MWILLLSPILALFPIRWRNAIRFSRPFPWVPAAIVSGLLESLLALVALIYWYSHSVETWANRALDAALQGNAAARSVPGQALGFAALALWAFHPLTWATVYFAVEGAVRALSAHSAGDIRGTLPLYLADWILGRISGRPPAAEAVSGMGPVAALSSIARASHERARLALTQRYADEMTTRIENGEGITEIQCQKAKPDWTPPRVVRIRESYYRLEKADRKDFPRPYRYTLRELPAGVPGRNVLIYVPEEPQKSDEQHSKKGQA
jgi:hypothetical protein